MPFTKTTFVTGDIISAQFLNDLQDAVIALQDEKRVILYDEEGSGVQVPYNIGTAVRNTPVSGIKPTVTPKVGDTILGITTTNVATVTAVSSTTMTVTGIGKRLNTL